MALVNPHGKEKKLKPLLLNGEGLKEERQKYFSPIAQRFREFVHSFAREHLGAPRRDVGKEIKSAVFVR